MLDYSENGQGYYDDNDDNDGEYDEQEDEYQEDNGVEIGEEIELVGPGIWRKP